MGWIANPTPDERESDREAALHLQPQSLSQPDGGKALRGFFVIPSALGGPAAGCADRRHRRAYRLGGPHLLHGEEPSEFAPPEVPGGAAGQVRRVSAHLRRL